MTPPEANSHCTYCGSPLGPGPASARPCSGCGRTNHRNPLPVAVALLPVRDGDRTGLLVVRRAVPPQLGLLALPGGFIDHGEDWRCAVVRELAEETGIAAAPGAVRLADVLSGPDHLLVFGLLPVCDREELPPSVPTDETDGWGIRHGPGELAFPLHTRVANAWFAGRLRD
ncbi:NUDIX domain-containing protein [Streptomyces meridianus]|uniref:NUDIX domain-containing protein n=1 Tax=Streptomyces meridianus TaxID=2938945 RepID=A0ABT0XBD9_9ACTN|nr:NUDIX domain-containing protein [Streptomyces meridianus]MCM2579258.1 NUDIX domain-containing protein [Streptomyces meridianus]